MPAAASRHADFDSASAAPRIDVYGESEDGEVLPQPQPDVTMAVDDEREEGELSDAEGGACAQVDSATAPDPSAVNIAAASSSSSPALVPQARSSEQDDSEPQRKRKKTRRGKGAEMARRSKHREARRIRRRAMAAERERAATAGGDPSTAREAASESEVEAALSMASVAATGDVDAH
ncbi:hypothetical protein EVG20_g10214 [Dentipellis fragilis]|uniref:Uncharacterized protein n=1 Tax=Dentipellis fragilis TaxID=205917 RepID=A0A4Y9XSD9_9AGAM|nr:hypothetical protein EVG20_g10214 [Dentipellis fragilis]